MVGETIDQWGGNRAMLYKEGQSGQPMVLPFLDRNNRSTARGVNNAGVIVGWQTIISPLSMRAARWTPVSGDCCTFLPAELAPPPGSPPGSVSFAFKINNAGLIVGSVTNSVYGERAVVWKDGTGFYLDPLNYPDYSYLPLVRAVDINDDAKILCRRQPGYSGMLIWE